MESYFGDEAVLHAKPVSHFSPVHHRGGTVREHGIPGPG